MIKPIYYFILFFLLFNCKGNNDITSSDFNKKDTSSISKGLDSITISKLPYKFKYDYNNPTINGISIDDFFKENKGNPINSFYSDSTILSNSTFQKINYTPYVGKGIFLKRFPNINDSKLLLFVYNHSTLNYFLPIFELQIFDKSDKIVDKLIVAGGREYECGWDRHFKIDTNKTLLISNLEYCFDIEEDMEVFRNEADLKYRITSLGFQKID